MEIIQKDDYVLYATQSVELVKKAILGIRMFNPIDFRVERVTDIFIRNKKKNVGTLFKKKWEVYPVITGFEIEYYKGNQQVKKLCSLSNSSGVLWVEELIPSRNKLYRELEQQFTIWKYLK